MMVINILYFDQSALIEWHSPDINVATKALITDSVVQQRIHYGVTCSTRDRITGQAQVALICRSLWLGESPLRIEPL